MTLLDPEAAMMAIHSVLQLKLQQRRTREELVSQGIMPPLKSPAAFHEQRKSLERARTEDYLKRKIRSRPERSELVRMHILEETSAEPSLQAKQLKLKRARLADDLNEKIAQRPGPMELIEKNILPVESSLKEVIIGHTAYPKDADNSSFDEDSSDALSPDQPGSQESQGSLPSPVEQKPIDHTIVCIHAPAQILAPKKSGIECSKSLPSEPQPSRPPPNEVIPPTKPTPALIKQSQPKSSSDKSQRSKKAKDSKPKVKKLKYHQYIPPDQKQEKGVSLMDSSYAKILQQQQLFLQLQILSQQQHHHYNYQTILPAPPKPPDHQQQNSSSTGTSRNLSNSSTSTSGHGGLVRQNSSAPSGKPSFLPANLDDMKVAELKQELKLRGLPVSGTKTDLIERLKNYQEQNGASSVIPDTSVTTSKSGASTAVSKSNEVVVTFPATRLPPTQTLVASVAPADVLMATVRGNTLMTFGSTSSTPPVSPTPSEPSFVSVDDSMSNDAFSEIVTSPLTHLTLQSSPVQILVKEENSKSGNRSCAAPPGIVMTQKTERNSFVMDNEVKNKDLMLQEKDKQIEELTRMLKQKQQLVESLRMQLEQEKLSQHQGNGVPNSDNEQHALNVQVKQEGRISNNCAVEQKSLPSKSQGLSSISQLNGLSPSIAMKISNQKDNLKLNKTATNAVIVKQEAKETTELSAQQITSVSQIFVSHGPPFQTNSIDASKILKSPPPSLITDSTGTHFVLRVTNQNAEIRNLSQPTDGGSRAVLQRVQSSPTKLSDQSQLHFLANDFHSKQELQQGLINQPVRKGQKSGLHLVTAASPAAGLPFSAPPSLQPFFLDNVSDMSDSSVKTNAPNKNEKFCPAQKHVSQPSSPAQPTQMNHEQQLTLFGTSSSSPVKPKDPPNYEEAVRQKPCIREQKNKEEHNCCCQQMDDLFDILIQSGEISADFSEESLEAMKALLPQCRNPSDAEVTSVSASHGCPDLQLNLSVDSVSSKSKSTPGRLEDFLESTTGVPLLTAGSDGTEPLSLIDDLHSEMLSSSSILDHPPSPMDTSELHFSSETTGLTLDLADTNLDNMDWFEFTSGSSMSLPPMNTTTPSVFSTDFLDGSDLQLQWDSCL
ncbi:myocardin-related transcription factor A isoform X2 [Protopterus annectens]|uniref:myocardin-related transcription factor A isoform X2 n=1 Tax=Protopterus annectens TaxID=7888 RepID=UPI001CFBA288|nr:myocardin-related transcription factor A isoform X2 [Protopterus annectens]